jgi:predicted nucleotide-binding protein
VEAIVSSKLSAWKIQYFGLWTDMVEPAEAPVATSSAAELMDLEEAAHQAKFRELRAKIAQDMASMTAYNAQADENKRRSHVVSVMHERAQAQIGKEFLVSNFKQFMLAITFLPSNWFTIKMGMVSTLNPQAVSFLLFWFNPG